jgi:hypothetical protein
MKKTLKLFGIALMIACLGAPAFAFYWGGSFDNTSTGKFSASNSFEQKDKLNVWIGQEFSQELALVAQGSYLFAWSNPSLSTDQNYLFDLDKLIASGTFLLSGGADGAIRYEAGRMALYDITGNIYGGTIDGARVGYSNSLLSASIFAGYTGLLLTNTTPVKMSIADYALIADKSAWTGGRRIVEALTVNFPELFLRQDLTFEAVLEQDLNTGLAKSGDTASAANGPSYNAEYLTLQIGGPITGPLYASLFGTLQLGQTLVYQSTSYAAVNQLAFQAGASIRAYLEEIFSSRAELSFLFTSGDKDASGFVNGATGTSWAQFVPITPLPLGTVFELTPGNMMRLLASYSLKPLTGLEGSLFKEFLVFLKALGFFRPTTGAIALAGSNPASTSPYLGLEVDLGLNWRPLSDLGLALTGGAFVPNNGSDGALFESSWKTRFLLRGELSFSF